MTAIHFSQLWRLDIKMFTGLLSSGSSLPLTFTEAPSHIPFMAFFWMSVSLVTLDNTLNDYLLHRTLNIYFKESISNYVYNGGYHSLDLQSAPKAHWRLFPSFSLLWDSIVRVSRWLMAHTQKRLWEVNLFYSFSFAPGHEVSWLPPPSTAIMTFYVSTRPKQ
jgi:hypothetical protein